MIDFYFVLLIFTVFNLSESYQLFPEWNLINGRLNQQRCVDIPSNLTLCHGIGYEQMRLPNLLDHDTMVEVLSQASSWVPLLNLKCHSDTRVFLCSLFAPICLDRLIYPCTSLCEAVKHGCEKRMENYGYPWPAMLSCDKFPADNDMCITTQTQDNADSSPCTVCNQPQTIENIIDHFCRSDFVVKAKIQKWKKQNLSCKKTRVLRVAAKEGLSRKELKKPTFVHANLSDCCYELLNKAGKKAQLLIMGTKIEKNLVASFIMKWNKSPLLKKVSKLMKKLNCSDPKMLSETIMGDAIFRVTADNKDNNNNKEKRKKEKKGERSRRRSKS
ncbi:secreted frizzled-related protein 5-like [Centruroides vittatus]|uniref:secreted frizzled-related protein 5-like n=1 Tax=Centruroides vittatus TaxID=120091 RepID=UPI003510415D